MTDRYPWLAAMAALGSSCARVAVLAVLACLVGSYAAPSRAADCNTRTFPVANSHVGGDHSDGGTETFPPPAGCEISSWRFIERSKFGDASYSASLRRDGILLVQWHIHSSTVRGPFGIVVDTHTAALSLDVEVMYGALSQAAEAPRAQVATASVQAGAAAPASPQVQNASNLASIGTAAVGIIVGLVVGLLVVNTRKWQLKFATGVLGVIFAGAATKFLEAGKPSRFLYPVGVLVGLIVIRLSHLRREAPEGRPQRLVSALEALLLLAVILGAGILAVNTTE